MVETEAAVFVRYPSEPRVEVQIIFTSVAVREEIGNLEEFFKNSFIGKGFKKTYVVQQGTFRSLTGFLSATNCGLPVPIECREDIDINRNVLFFLKRTSLDLDRRPILSRSHDGRITSGRTLNSSAS